MTGLDPASQGEMYRIIRELNEKDGMTVIMVSHDVVRALDCANRILCLCSSSESFFGTTEEYLDSHLGRDLIG